MKNCIFWDAKKVPLRNKSGAEIPSEFHGVFSTKVDPTTPGAIHYKGANESAKIEWDYHAKECTVIRGYLRWVDKVLPTFDGARAQIAVFIESEKALHKISLKYDATNLKDVMNAICGLGAHAATTFLNVQYGVWKAKNAKGEYKLTAKNEIRWAQQLQFVDVTPKFDYDQWRDFSQQNGLEWQQTKKADGSTVWNSDAELKYWDSLMVKVQQFLLKEDIALPFTYGSLIACEAQNPSGGGNLTKAEIEQCGRIYERIKAQYKMPFGRREEVDADDYDPNANYTTPSPVQLAEQMPINNVGFPEYDTRDIEDQPSIAGFDDQELPF